MKCWNKQKKNTVSLLKTERKLLWHSQLLDKVIIFKSKKILENMSYRNEERKSLWPHIFSSNWNEQIRIKGYGPAGQLMKHISVTFWFGLYLSWENNEELSLRYISFLLSNWMIGFLLFKLLLKHPSDLLFETEYWVGEEWLLTELFLNWVPFAGMMSLWFWKQLVPETETVCMLPSDMKAPYINLVRTYSITWVFRMCWASHLELDF